MAFTGGDFTEATYNHEDLGSGTIFFKANEDGTVDLGGYRSNDDQNAITGDGQIIDQMNRVRASIETPPVAWDMLERDELNALTLMAESPKKADWTLTHISGAIFAGKGKPVGDVQGSTNAANVGLTLHFDKKLKRIE